jgi:NitT/TauT family transport system substrate-binding protein
LRLTFIAVLATAFALLTNSANGDAPATIRVVGPANDGFKAVYYGVKSGLFEKAGLDVQPTIVASGAAAAAAIVGGGADVAYTNMLALIQAHSHGVGLQIVAGGPMYLSETPSTAMIVLKDSSIRTGRDLTGKLVGSPSLKDINAVATYAWIDQTGGDSKSVRAVEVPASAAVAMLQEHRVDAVTINEPSVSQALATGAVRILAHPIDVMGKHVQVAAFVAMDTTVSDRHDVMLRFSRALHDASAYTNTHLPETVDLVVGYTGAKPEDIARGGRFIDADTVRPSDIQPIIDLVAKYGAIDKPFPAEELISTVAPRGKT